MSTAATSKLANATLKVPAQLWPGAERASNALQGLLPSKLPSALSASKKNLYETLARLPPDAVQGTVVHQTRWGRKGIEGSYWKITRLQTKNMGSNGKAWGVLYWRGKQVSERPERIRGALKYHWKEGASETAPATAA